MKLNYLILCIFNLIIIIQCKSQSKEKLNDFKGEEILRRIFNSKDGFKEYCNELDSLFYSYFFKVSCDFIEGLDKEKYNEIRKKADSFEIVYPEIYDGGFYYKCDPRTFEYLKYSCVFYNQYPELRMRKILNSIIELKYENSKDRKIIDTLIILFRENIKLVPKDSLISIYEEIKFNYLLQKLFLVNLKYSGNFKNEYINYLKYFLIVNRNNFNNYNYILQYFSNIFSEDSYRIEVNNILVMEKKYISSSFAENDPLKSKLIELINNHIAIYNLKH